jgi:hypothetical protein
MVEKGSSALRKKLKQQNSSTLKIYIFLKLAILSIAKLLQSSEFRLIDYLLKQVDIAMFHMMKECVSIAI